MAIAKNKKRKTNDKKLIKAYVSKINVNVSVADHFGDLGVGTEKEPKEFSLIPTFRFEFPEEYEDMLLCVLGAYSSNENIPFELEVAGAFHVQGLEAARKELPTQLLCDAANAVYPYFREKLMDITSLLPMRGPLPAPYEGGFTVEEITDATTEHK